MKTGISLYLAFLLSVPTLLAKDPPYRSEPDIVYGKGGDHALMLDLFRPLSGDGPFPAVIFIHGGGWHEGNRKNHVLTNMAPLLATQGYVAASISYRLAPKAKFPAHVEDCKCAVRWMRANAKKYNVNPKRIGVAGISAGGHLVSMLGTTTGVKDLEGSGGHGDYSSAVQAVVAFCPATDLATGDWIPQVDKILIDFIGGPLAKKADAYRRASPVHHVAKGRSYPPFLFFHGTADPLVNYQQSVKLHEALQAAGGSSRLELQPGEGHVWVGSKMEKSLKQTLEFFDEHLKH